MSTEKYERGWQQVPVTLLRPAPWNFKKDDDRRSELLKEKLKNALLKRGQIVNVVTRELPDGTLELVDGNHRLPVFAELGMKVAHAYHLGECSQAEAELVAAELYELGWEADPLKLGALFKHAISEIPINELVETLPLTEEEILQHTKVTDFDWNDYKAPIPDDSATVTGGRNVKIELNISVEKAQEFKDAIKAFPTHDDAVTFCVDAIARRPAPDNGRRD